jgi:hypothetical protein
MTLIYPREAWDRFGPPPIIVRDARGKVLRSIVACDPLTGETIQHLPANYWAGPMLIATERIMEIIGAFMMAGFGVIPSRVEMAKRHFFAPAPLTVSRPADG